MKTKFLYHLRQVGFDLLVGAAVFLAPAVAADDFSWSANWWIVVAGALARRAISTIVRYVIRTWGSSSSAE